MGWLDWTFKSRFDTEREWLRALLEHTEAWHNEITGPLQGLLAEMVLKGTAMDPEAYARIARNLFEVKIVSNHGTSLSHTINQMGKRGIPLFTERQDLRAATEKYLRAGDFVKSVGFDFHGWTTLDANSRREVQVRVVEAWQAFNEAKDRLTDQINENLSHLG
jgi:hypothetical protein